MRCYKLIRSRIFASSCGQLYTVAKAVDRMSPLARLTSTTIVKTKVTDAVNDLSFLAN